MSSCLRTALIERLLPHLCLSKSDLETSSTPVIGLIHGRTVNLTHIASHCYGSACHASKSPRL